jgi:DNA-binding transcriptional MerR regulator
MNLTTISEISKKLSISTRTLRYYEQIGLIESVKKEDYAYRTYDETTVTRLQQILVLRKLRIPLKQIAFILKSENTAAIIDTFQQNLAEVDDEITALSTIRDIIGTFISRLKENIHQDIKLNLLDDTALLETVDALTVQKIPLKEEKTAEDLEQASEKLNKLTDRDVRIVYLPPTTVAAAYAVGCEPGPELVTDDMIQKFIKDTNLESIYPASRHYGFNNPDEPVHGEGHGYERYITIPDDMEVQLPLTKKYFKGGVYAGVTIPMGDWDVWMKLHEWVCNSERYEFRWETIKGVCGWIEEHLNYWNWYTDGLTMEENDRNKQIELLIPIKSKKENPSVVKAKLQTALQHSHEKIIETFDYNGAIVELVEWQDTIWCGKIGYAVNNTDEPNVDEIMTNYKRLSRSKANGKFNPVRDGCISVNYLSTQRPNGVFFGQMVKTEDQPDGFDILNIPTAQFMRINICSETAAALGREMWHGGIPPYEWIYGIIAPNLGYKPTNDTIPIVEYYGHYKPDLPKSYNNKLLIPV